MYCSPSVGQPICSASCLGRPLILAISRTARRSIRVTATPSEAGGRRALRVELTDEVTFNGSPGVDYVDQPTFVVLPVPFTSGTIEVDVLSRLNGKGPDDARAFAGLAYRITQNADHFESIY